MNIFYIYLYMRKYIFTEQQLNLLVNKVIIENQMLMESHQILNLHDLAEILSRTKMGDQETHLELLHDIYKEAGDEGIIELFHKHIGIEITDISHGHYVIK